MRSDSLLLAVFAAGAFFMLTRTIKDLSPRGYRLNNPGNIKEFHKDYIDWVGEDPIDIDPTLEEFERPEFGFRALGKVLNTFWSKRGITTIRQMVTRYAPSTENDTAAYIANVAKWLGIDPDRSIDLEENKLELVKAITRQEQGYIAFTDEFIYNSLQLA